MVVMWVVSAVNAVLGFAVVAMYRDYAAGAYFMSAATFTAVVASAGGR